MESKNLGKRILDWFINLFSKFTTACGLVFDEVVKMLKDASGKPIKLLGVLVILGVGVDIVLGGELKFISYLIAQINTVITMLIKLKISTMVFISFIVALFIMDK